MAICRRPAAVDRPEEMPSRKRRRLVGTTHDFDTEACVGEGTFGAVVKARHRATGKVVAIKSLHDPIDDYEPADPREQLLREARLLEACGGHPNIVGFQGVVRDDVTDDLSLVTEYVPGQSLEQLLGETRGGLPEATARGLMCQLLGAAERMHGRRIVHRDIKPANVIVGEGEEIVKICDFGFALSLSEAPPYDEDAGTMWYRAPEMLAGFRNYGALVDAWSLGCVMAEILTGERLFQAKGSVLVLRRIFQVVGTPDDSTWPGFASPPRQFAAELQKELTGQQSTLREMFPEEKLSKEGFDVLNGLLTCNPDRRLTAAAALKLPWFATLAANAQPLPPPATPAVSIKEEEVEISPWRRKRVTARRTLFGKNAQQLIVKAAA